MSVLRPPTLRAAASRRHTLRILALARHESTTVDAAAAPVADITPSPTPQQGWLYIDSVFPIRIGRWDPRHYIGLIREDTLLAKLQTILSAVHIHEFTVLELEPQTKDGGVFARFQFTAPGKDAQAARDAALKRIEEALHKELHNQGGVPNWMGFGNGSIWLVKGRPWREDLNRYPSPILKVAFEGPDVHEEALYNLFRPFGRIQDIANPTPAPAGALRTATVTFRHLGAATIARNVIHGITYESLQASGATPARTRLRTLYQPPVQAHAVRDWLQSHPKIAGPLLLFLVGSLTYTVFDPIRTFMVEGRILDWFDYKQYQVYQWIHGMAEPFFGLTPIPTAAAAAATSNEEEGEPRSPRSAWSWFGDDSEVWEERREAQDSLERYLADLPSTVAFVHGPQGSGKTRMLAAIVEKSGRKTLVIDCAQLLKDSSDSSVVNSLAYQTGYWPVFSFLNSFGTWIDLASVGLIGQKAGLSTSLPTQVHDMLEVVKTSLSRVSASYRADAARAARAERIRREREKEEIRRLERLARGEWHDGRLDCVAGNGVMSELGIGDERFEGWTEQTQENGQESQTQPVDSEKNVESYQQSVRPDVDSHDGIPQKDQADVKVEQKSSRSNWRVPFLSLPSVSIPDVNLSTVTTLPEKLLSATGLPAPSSGSKHEDKDEGDDNSGRPRAHVQADAVDALPVVVLRNYGSRAGANKDADEVLTEIARWAAGLTENQIAHVVVMSDNRENSKRLAKALPSKPLTSIALSDADAASALSFVSHKLEDIVGPNALFTAENRAHVGRLGGRARDLESLIHKVRGGLSIQEAVEDIIQRDVAELRKNAFGDDAEDAKSLPWTREEAWQLMKQLVKKDEVAYYDILVNMFKNDETSLRSMEHAELISISTNNGRPATIRPGKPVYKYVFERLVSDPIFRATLDLAVNEKSIASNEAIVKTCEEELLKLREIGSSRTVRKREDHVLDKMYEAQKKIVALETESVDLKKILAKGG